MSTPEQRARHVLEAADAVRRAVVQEAGIQPKATPPRSAFRSNLKGRRAWLQQSAKTIARDLERIDQLEDPKAPAA